MADAGPAWRGITATQAAVLSSALWLAALALVLAVSSEPWRTGCVVGLVCTFVSSATGLAATVLSEGGALNRALLGRAVAFVIRMLLLAVGLVVTIKMLHAEPLGFVLTFFPFFFVTSALEQLVSWSAQTRKAPSAPGAGGGAR